MNKGQRRINEALTAIIPIIIFGTFLAIIGWNIYLDTQPYEYSDNRDNVHHKLSWCSWNAK